MCASYVHVRPTGDFKQLPGVDVRVIGLCPVMDRESVLTTSADTSTHPGSFRSRPTPAGSDPQRAEIRLHYLKV